MDFIVVGFGLGALVMLLGTAVRDFAPRLNAARQAPPAEDSPSDLPPVITLRFVSPQDWDAACRSIGLAFIIGGALIIGAAMLGIVAHMSNRTGARLVLAVSLLAFGGVSLRIGVILSSVPGLDPRSRLRARLARTPKVEEQEPEKPAGARPEPAPSSDVEPAALVVAEAPGAMATNGVVPATPRAEPTVEPSLSPSDFKQLLAEMRIDVSGEIQIPVAPPETTIAAADGDVAGDAATTEQSDADSTKPATPNAAPDAVLSEAAQAPTASAPGEEDEPGAAPAASQEDEGKSEATEVAASSRPVA